MKTNLNQRSRTQKNIELENECYEKMAMARWEGSPSCPYCKTANPYEIKINELMGYKCRNKKCFKKFTVKTGLMFENSNIPLSTWFEAINACTNRRIPISCGRLARNLKVTEKTAWFMIFRIREALEQNQSPLLNYIAQKLN